MQIKIRNVKSERFEKTFTQPLTIAAIGISFDKNDFYVNFISFYKKEQEKKNVLQHRNRQDKIRVIDSFSRFF